MHMETPATGQVGADEAAQPPAPSGTAGGPEWGQNDMKSSKTRLPEPSVSQGK